MMTIIGVLRVIAILAIAAVAAAPALAADLGAGSKDALETSPAYVSARTWTGFTLSAAAGESFRSVDMNANAAGIDAASYSFSSNGGFFEAALEYDYQLKSSPIVIGLRGQGGWSNTNHRGTYGAVAVLGLASNQMLFYAIAGVEKEHQADAVTMPAYADVVKSVTGDPSAFVLGGGVTTRLADHVIVGVEGRWLGWGSISSSATSDGGTAYTVSQKSTEGQILARIGYQF